MSNTIIDHAIAIPTRQRNVWEHLRDLQKNPLWQVDSEAISFLTTTKNGRGTRYRSITTRGSAQVVEITAWYEGLGYEYVIVDGVPYAKNLGRIRLQESTDGTIVQWTFTYELKGFLSGLRDSLSVRRSVDNEIVDSLRNLYSYIRTVRGEEKFVAEESDAYLKEAPDVEARSQYQPRYPSKVEVQSSQFVEENEPEPIIEEPEPLLESVSEPPVAEDDTKPNPSVQDKPEIEAPPLPKPTFLQTLRDFSLPPSEQQVKPTSLPHFDDTSDATESITAPTPRQADESTVFQPTLSENAPDQPQSTPESEPTYSGPLPLIEKTDLSDTSRISVFEVFGLPKPSETEKLSPIREEEIAAAEQAEADAKAAAAFMADEPIVPDVEPPLPRQGLRVSLRRKQTRIRLPK